MNIDMILETISAIGTMQHYSIHNRVLLIEKLLELTKQEEQ